GTTDRRRLRECARTCSLRSTSGQKTSELAPTTAPLPASWQPELHTVPYGTFIRHFGHPALLLPQSSVRSVPPRWDVASRAGFAAALGAAPRHRRGRQATPSIRHRMERSSP